MIAWIRSTSGRMALRVRNIGFGLLQQNGKLLASFVDCLLHAVRGSTAGDVMSSQDGLDCERSENVLIERRAELTQFGEGQILELAAAVDAFLNGVRDDLVRFAKGHAALDQISSGSEGVHEAAFACGLHAIEIECDL